MKKVILFTLSLICVILVLSEPSNDINWYATLFISKGIGFGSGYLVYILWSKWYGKEDTHVQD